MARLAYGGRASASPASQSTSAAGSRKATHTRSIPFVFAWKVSGPLTWRSEAVLALKLPNARQPLGTVIALARESYFRSRST